MMNLDEAIEMIPERQSYDDEDNLVDEFCMRVGCRECYGTQPESCEPNGYGCDIMESWVNKYYHLVGGEENQIEMRNLRELSGEKLAEKRKRRLVKPPITPRYDDVYSEGVKWLDSLADPQLPEGEKEELDEDI